LTLAERQEKWLRNGSLVSLWVVCLSIIVTYAWLIAFLKADILIPLKVIIVVGFSYWMFASLVATAYHLYSLHLGSPMTLCIKLASLPASMISAYFLVPSIVTLQTEIEIHSFEPYVIWVYGIGAFAVLGGLVAVTYYSRRND
jgi:hypothetical protein